MRASWLLVAIVRRGSRRCCWSLASEVDPSIPVLFLDTGMHFGQTLDYRKSLTAKLGLTDVRDLRPQYQDLATQDPSANLYKTSTDACCNIRKVLPLDRGSWPISTAGSPARKRFQGGDAPQPAGGRGRRGQDQV